MTEMVERVARVVYELMPFDGKYPDSKPDWVDGGNSLKQGEARRYARAAIYCTMIDAALEKK